jgi:hypothetical protein
MENHLDTFYFGILLTELVDPKQQRGQPDAKKIVIILHC